MGEYKDYDDDDEDRGNDTRERILDELEAVHSTLKSKTDLAALFWIVICILLLGTWAGSRLDRWTDKEWYSLRYGADSTNITVDKRPSDCDFSYAPMGNKGCHYDKNVVVVKRATDVQTGRRVISYDGGKAWAWDDGDTEPKGTTVSIYWSKVSD